MKSNILVKYYKTLIIVTLAFFSIVFSIYAAEGDKPKSAEELRKEAAEKAAALLKSPPGGKWRATAAEALEALDRKSVV